MTVHEHLQQGKSTFQFKQLSVLELLKAGYDGSRKAILVYMYVYDSQSSGYDLQL